MLLALQRRALGGPEAPLGPPGPSSYLETSSDVPQLTRQPPARARTRTKRTRPVDNLSQSVDNPGDVRTLRTTSSPPVTAPSPTLCGMTKTTPDLRPAEVARLLGVARQTVHDYESQGRLTAKRTPGGHRRYPASQPVLRAALEAQEAGQ